MTIEEVGAKLNALDVWHLAFSCHWAIKPHGCAVPYFCCTVPGDAPALKVRVLLLEGWQTFHDYLRTRVDNDFGFYLSPMELPHYELLVLDSGEVRLFRDDPGFLPRLADERECALSARMLWECYGVMLRLESDPKLPLRFADEKAIFARVQSADGTWRDEPLVIPAPRPHVEKVSFAKKDLAAAKDLPLRTDEVLELDLRLVKGLSTQEARPKFIYQLAAVDAKTGAIVFRDRTAIQGDSGLRGVWEDMAPRVLQQLIAHKAIPGEIRVMSGRVFRMLRPLGLELPFKLVKVTDLPHFPAALQNLV